MLKIINTLSGHKEEFSPLNPPKVTMYVCGITPYDHPHIGHGRVYVFFDFLYRLLKFMQYNVTYCRNFTDIDDKLMRRAQDTLGDQHRFLEIANNYIDSFNKAMLALNCLPPTYEPRVTDNIPDIIAFISALIECGKAYVVDGDVYYSIQSFPSYGKLSKQKLQDLRAGARVDIDTRKRDPLDFALWKREPEGTFWKSPWGYGRPGWHIECSALAKKFLGTQIDIHGGGMDLMFPHHENEIAQSEGLTDRPLATYWLHMAFVRINKEKMSKSLGNFITLHEVLEQVDPMVLRFYYLSHHYRAPLDFSYEDLAVAEKTYQKLCLFFNQHHCDYEYVDGEIAHNPIVKEMLAMLRDDLNTPGMFGVVFSHLKQIGEDTKTFCSIKLFIQRVLGLTLKPLPEKKVEITPEIKKLLEEREQARKEKDFKRADAIRDQLKQLGIEVQDTKMKK